MTIASVRSYKQRATSISASGMAFPSPRPVDGWRYPNGRRLTRLITARLDGSDIRVVIGNGYASHFIWRDRQHILSQSRNFLSNDNWGDYLFEDKEGAAM